MTTETKHEPPQEPRATQLRAEGAVYRGRLLRQPEGHDAEAWEHERAFEFAGESRLRDVAYASNVRGIEYQYYPRSRARVFTPDNIATLRSRGLLPPLDSEGTPRPDWVGLGRWRSGFGHVVDFDRGVIEWGTGREHALAPGDSAKNCRSAGYTPETESAPKRGGRPVSTPTNRTTAPDGCVTQRVRPRPRFEVFCDASGRVIALAIALPPARIHRIPPEAVAHLRGGQ